MMTIKLVKFGTILVSRPSGKEAWLAFQPRLNQIDSEGEVLVDFKGVDVLTPSWADEFLTPLVGRLGTKVSFKNDNNPSVQATLSILNQ